MQKFLQSEEISAVNREMNFFGGLERHVLKTCRDMSARHAVSFVWGPLEENFLKTYAAKKKRFHKKKKRYNTSSSDISDSK